MNYNITMGSASSRCTEHNGEAEISFDSCDASELALQSASDLVRRSKIPIVTVRLSQIYNRNMSVFFGWSIFFSQLHAKRRLQYAKDVNLGSNLLARGAFMRMDPSEPRYGLLLPTMILSSCTCLEVTYSAYMRFCACGLTTHLIIFLSGATRDLHRSSIVRQQILNRVYSYGFVQEAAASLIACNQPISIWTAVYGNVDLVSAFLDLGLNVNAKSKIGDSPLHFAAREGSFDTAKLLLDKGARVNEPGYEGTPYATAIRHKNEDVAHLLLQRGANPETGKRKFFR